MKGKIPPAFLSCDTKDLSRQERKVDQTENIQAGIISHTHTLSQREHTLNDTPQVKKRLRRSRHSRRERARGTDRRYLLQWPLIFSGAVTYLLQSNNIWLMAKEVALLPWLWINLLVIWITMMWFFWKATAGQNVWISFSVFFSTPERYYRVSMYHSNGFVCFFMREANMKKTTQLWALVPGGRLERGAAAAFGQRRDLCCANRLDSASSES